MSDATRCLANAIDIIRQSTVLDDVAKTEVLGPLERILQSKTLSDQEKLARMAYEMRDAKQRAYIQRVAMAMHEVYMDSTATWDGRDLQTAITPLFGNRGSTESPSLTSEISAQIRSTGAKLRPVFQLITDVRYGLIRDSERGMNFVKAAEGMPVDDAEAVKAARLYHETLRPWLERLRNAGVWVEDITNYFPHSHDIIKIQADKEGWKAFLRANLDAERHPDAESSADAIFNTLVTAKHETPEQATITMARQVRFKSPEAAAEYFFRYGNGSATDVAQKSMETVVSRTLIAEKLGPRASMLVTQRAESIKKADEASIAGDLSRRKELKKDIRRAQHAEDIMAEVTGALEQPRHPEWANWSGAARNLVSALKLGKVALASVGDYFNASTQARFHTGGFMSGTWEQARASLDVLSNSQLRELVENLGLWTHAVQANSIHRMGSAFDMANPLAPDTSGVAEWNQKALAWSVQASSFTQRVTAAQALERGMRSAYGLIGARALRKHSRKSWADLPERYRKIVLQNNGISERDWDVLREQAAGVEIKGTGALDVTKITDQAVRQKFETMIVREAEIAVVMPNTADRHLLTFGTQAGTIPGEASAALTQFMSWPLSFARNAMSREVQAGGVGAFGAAGAAVASGVLQVQLYALASGEPMYSWEDPGLWYRGFTRSAIATPLWPMVAGIFNGRGASSILNAPVLDIYGGTITGIWRAVDEGILEGNADEGLAELLRAVEGVTPNYWFLQAGVDKISDYAMWSLDPAYMQRQQSRLLSQGRDAA